MRIAGEEAALIKTLPEGESWLALELSFSDVKTWSPETPVLYTAEAQLERDGEAFDDLIDRFGFRKITIRDGRILLNCSPLRIRGLCRHEDHPHFGCALPYEAMMHDLLQIKDLGANSVRTAHDPNDERFLDLCDELGILVWEENHVRGLSSNRCRTPTLSGRRRKSRGK